MAETAQRFPMESILSPGRPKNVDADKYWDMRHAMLASLPAEPPGVTSAELKRSVLPRLSEALFSGGDRAGWWMKGVQLDLEAKGLVARSETSPLRFHATRKDGGAPQD